MIGEHTDKYLADAIESEYDHCVTKHGPFKNQHEAYAVLKEEMEEVQDAAELFNGRAMRNLDTLWIKVKDDEMDEAYDNINAIYNTAEEMAKECIQVMAVCRKWNDLIEKENEPEPEPEQKKAMSELHKNYLVEKFARDTGCEGIAVPSNTLIEGSIF